MADEKSSGFGISGFVLGIISLTAGIGFYLFGPFLTGAIIAIVGLVFCIKQQKRHKTKKGKIGIIINLIGIIVNAVLFIYTLVFYVIPYISEYLQSGV
jgi:hypothetical protein